MHPHGSTSRLAILLLLAAGCDCSARLTPAWGLLAAEDDVTGGAAETLTLDLGDVFPGQTAVREITLLNLGRASIVVDTAERISGDALYFGAPPDSDHPFAIQMPEGNSIESGGKRRALILFAQPATALHDVGPGREFATTVTLTAISSTESVRLNLVARLWLCPVVNPLSLDLGPVIIGQDGRASLEIDNSAPLAVELHYADDGRPLAPFAISDPVPFRVAGQSTVAIEVDFQPPAAYQYDQAVTFVVNEWCPPLSRILGGKGSRALLSGARQTSNAPGFQWEPESFGPSSLLIAGKTPCT